MEHHAGHRHAERGKSYFHDFRIGPGQPLDHRILRRRYKLYGQHLRSPHANGETRQLNNRGIFAEPFDVRSSGDLHGHRDGHIGDAHRDGDVQGWKHHAGTGTLSAGKATFTTATLKAGTHSITAVYGGDTNFAGSTSPALSQAVNKAASTTSVASSMNPSGLAQSVTFTATVKPATSGTPTGTVTFKDGTTTLGTGTLSGGKATFTTSALALGSHSITASYAGDTNFTASTSAALTQTVKPASSTTVASSLNPSTFGQAVTFTATVTATSGTPTGMVTFKDGTTTLGTGTLSGGKAMLTTSTLAAGSHSITAVYGGDANFTSSTSPVLTQKVNP